MVTLAYTTRHGNGVVRHVPDSQLEKSIRKMHRARLRCVAYAEDGMVVGEVKDGANEYGRQCLTWWVHPEPSPPDYLASLEELAR